MFAAALFQKRNGVARAAARGKHGVYQHNDFIIYPHGKFAVIFLWFEGFFVTVHTYMPYLCGGEKRKYTVHHTETRS